MVARSLDSRFLNGMMILLASTSHVTDTFRSGCRTVSGVGWMAFDLGQIIDRTDLYL